MSGVSGEDETIITLLQSKGSVSHILLPAFRRQRHGRSSDGSLAMLRCTDLCLEPRTQSLRTERYAETAFRAQCS